MKVLPEAFLTRMQSQLGAAFSAYLAAMEQSPKRALRVNTLKILPKDFASCVDFPLSPTGLTPESFFVPDDVAVGRHPLHAAGLFYMQEPSAQMPVSLLTLHPGMAVLDLCAAPGGKSGQIAAALGKKGLLVSNEPIASRANVLMYNLERMGVANGMVTSMYPDALCRITEGFFDAVVVDAPCSGEGMFRKDDSAVTDWSPSHVAACAARQRQILAAAQLAVKPGGQLLYSTCTFSQAENEDMAAWFLSAYPAFRLVTTRRMYPHDSIGEGQFAALFIRDGALSPSRCGIRAEKPCAPFQAFCRESMSTVPSQETRELPDGRVLLLPEILPFGWEKLHVLRCGVLAGEVKKKCFFPDHALFLSLPADAFLRTVELTGAQLAAYYAGEVLPCDPQLSGWCAVSVRGYCTGFAKAVDGQLKNHYPKGLRTR